MSAKVMNVKVSTEKLIKALEEALQKRLSDKAKAEKEQEEYTKEVKKFEQSLIELVGTKKLTLLSASIRNQWRSESKEVEFTFSISDSVKAPVAPESNVYRYMNNEVAEIQNAIAILKMTDEEYVSTSTYKGVAQYL